MTVKSTEQRLAVIYSRVSSERQVREGDGLRSQETTCRDFAKRLGLKVVKTFQDKGISGALLPTQRPAAREMLAFLKQNQNQNFFVIIDNVDRMARDPVAYHQFAALMAAYGAQFISPSHQFGSSPVEELNTELMVSIGSFHRKSNRLQVISRQKSRLENGFLTYKAPRGYVQKRVRGGGSVMFLDEKIAPVVKEALEGFASGRFDTQADVARFLDQSGCFKNKSNRTAIRTMLTCPIYAGYIEFPKWGVERREGQHEALISPATFFRIQERLGLRAKAPYRKDLNLDFPLRGFVLCPKCCEPMTASWSTSRTGTKHPYYHCKSKGCELYSKSRARDLVHSEMQALLETMRPAEATVELLRQIVEDVWVNKKREHQRLLSSKENELDKIDKDISLLMDKYANAKDGELSEMLEDRLKTKKLEKEAVKEASEKLLSVDTSLEEALGTIIDFISNPAAMWKSGDFEEQRLVLKLAFAERLPFDKDKGFGTTGKSLPFKVLEGLRPVKSKMVEGTGFEPVYS